MSAWLLRGIALSLALQCALLCRAAADPFVPKARHGTLKVASKNITADRRFSDSFASATRVSSSSVDERRLQVNGEYGLGDRWALEYELRAARISTGSKRGTTTGDEFGEQQFTFVRQLFATTRVAHAVGLDVVVVPGHGASAGAHYALQPEYQFGTRGPHGAFTSFMVGPRTYLGGHGTLLRLEGATGRELFPGLAGSLTLLYSATLGPKISTSLVEYSVLRAGVFLHGNSGRLRPEIGYERDIAGRGIHVAQHVVVGVGLGF